MSLINDALKEARQEKGSASSGQRMTIPPPRRPGSGNKGVIWALVVMGTVFTVVISGVVLLLIFIFLHMKEGPRNEGGQQIAAVNASPNETVAGIASTPLQPVRSPVTPAIPKETPPPVPAAVTPAPVTPSTPVIPPAPAAPGVPKPAVTVPPPAPAAPVKPPVPAVPAPAKIIPAPMAIQNAFVLKGIMKGRRGNMALINSRIVKQNDTLKNGASIEKVAETFVIINLDGKKYQLNYTQ